MKKIFLLSFAFAILIFSGRASAEEIQIDYGDSKIFSRADMDFCVEVIREKLEPVGCTIHNIRYGGDKMNSKENIKYLKTLAKARKINKKVTGCMFFLTDFLSPPDDGKISAWNYDCEYTDMQWWFAVYKDGSKELLTSGY